MQQTTEPKCLGCGYNLSATRTGRCPECGGTTAASARFYLQSKYWTILVLLVAAKFIVFPVCQTLLYELQIHQNVLDAEKIIGRPFESAWGSIVYRCLLGSPASDLEIFCGIALIVVFIALRRRAPVAMVRCQMALVVVGMIASGWQLADQARNM